MSIIGPSVYTASLYSSSTTQEDPGDGICATQDYLQIKPTNQGVKVEGTPWGSVF